MKKPQYGIYEFNHKEVVIMSINKDGTGNLLFHSYRLPSHKVSEALLEVLSKSTAIEYERVLQNIDSYLESLPLSIWN